MHSFDTDACDDIFSDTYYSEGGFTEGNVIYDAASGGSTISSGFYMFNGDNGTVYEVTGGGVPYYYSDCFSVVEGTLIHTSPSSSVPVEDLVVSDTVLTKDIESLDDDITKEQLKTWSSNNITGSASTALVASNISSSVSTVYSFNNDTLRTSRSHVHIVKRGSEWLAVNSLNVQVGDYFEDINGDLVEITDITAQTGSFTIYSLDVEPDDIYYANGILTHNQEIGVH